jgi:hypothetical protein
MLDWIILKSKLGHDEFGIPIGQILLRHHEDLEKTIKERNILDPVVEKFIKEK